MAEVTVPTVGIADGDNGNLRRALGNPLAVVPHTLALGDVLDLRDAGDQARHLLQLGLHVGLGGDAIETDTQAHHIHLRLGETCDARGIKDMM